MCRWSSPAYWFRQGKQDEAFRTKPALALELVDRVLAQGWPFRAVVADAFYGGNEDFRAELEERGVGFVLALGPGYSWWYSPEQLGSVREAAQAGPFGPDKPQRLIVATIDPATLPEVETWHLVSNLPAPGSTLEKGGLQAATLAEVARLYGLRVWIEQTYKQVKNTLGWAEYQVRSDLAMRRHWALVCCALSFCWWALAQTPSNEAAEMRIPAIAEPPSNVLPAVEKKSSALPAPPSVGPWHCAGCGRGWNPSSCYADIGGRGSNRPPPADLQRLLERLQQGEGIPVYAW